MSPGLSNDAVKRIAGTKQTIIGVLGLELCMVMVLFTTLPRMMVVKNRNAFTPKRAPNLTLVRIDDASQALVQL